MVNSIPTGMILRRIQTVHVGSLTSGASLMEATQWVLVSQSMPAKISNCVIALLRSKRPGAAFSGVDTQLDVADKQGTSPILAAEGADWYGCYPSAVSPPEAGEDRRSLSTIRGFEPLPRRP